MNPYLGMMFPFAGGFAINGFAFCDGQSLAINSNTALYSIIGTTYGGDGATTFKLPDLRGRVCIHQGSGPGLSYYYEGQFGGAESKTLLVSNMPAHTHSLNVSNNPGTVAVPAGDSFFAAGQFTGSGPNGTQLTPYTHGGSDVSLNSLTIGNTGGAGPFSLLQPYLTATWLIALQGVFPTRN